MNVPPTAQVLATANAGGVAVERHLLKATDVVIDALFAQYGVERGKMTIADGCVHGLWVCDKYVPGDVLREAFKLGIFRDRVVEYTDRDNPKAMVRTKFSYESGVVELTERDTFKAPPAVEAEARRLGLPPYSGRKLWVSVEAGTRTTYVFGDRRLVVTWVRGRDESKISED